ncbi:MAG: peptidoglycan-binding protein [Clostridia bacterium]|nr:peptidoglycan-binding protein [Clostridia bacterium]MBQ9041148.1 peptidoglycan-binding protein [Clostridia bacterium]
MKKFVAILVIFFLFSIFCAAFAETCDLDGLTFEVPLLFVPSDEIEGLKVYVQYLTQSFIACASTELDGMSLEDNIEDIVSEMGSAITNIDNSCVVNGIPYILVELNIEGEDGGQGKAAIFVDDVKLYAIIYVRIGTLTDYDLTNFENLLQSVNMNNPQNPVDSTSEQDKTERVTYTAIDIEFKSPPGFIEMSNDDDGLRLENEDHAVITYYPQDNEGLSTEAASKLWAYGIGVPDVQYDVESDIRGVPYVDFTFSDNIEKNCYGKAAMIIDHDTDIRYKFMYVKATELEEKDYESWNALLYSIQAPTILKQAILESESSAIPETTTMPDMGNMATDVFEALQKGDKGDNVKRLQEALISLGYLSDTADGNFGPKTEKAVETYQKAKGLQVTKIADHPTLTSIYSDEAALHGNAQEKVDEIHSNATPIPTPEPTAEPTPVPTVEPTEEATAEPSKESNDRSTEDASINSKNTADDQSGEMDQNSDKNNNIVKNNYSEIADLSDYVDCEFVSEYPHWDGMDEVILFTNNNEIPVRIEVNTTARNVSNIAIGSKEETVRMVPPGKSVPVFMYFEGADENTTYDYNIKIMESDIKDATNELSVEASSGKQKAIVVLTNNSDRDMSYCSAHCLFYKNGKLVYSNYEFIGHGLGNIGSGETYSGTVGSGRNDFDEFKWFVVAGYE